MPKSTMSEIKKSKTTISNISKVKKKKMLETIMYETTMRYTSKVETRCPKQRCLAPTMPR